MRSRILVLFGGIIVLIVIGVFAANMHVAGNNAQGCTAEAKICPDGTAVGRSGPKCEFAACPNGEAMFDKTGVITVDNPGSPGMQLVYETPGSPALRKMLAFDEQSMCLFPSGTILCLALNVPIATAAEGQRVRVAGIDRGADLLVRRLEVIGNTEPQLLDVKTALGQSISALGVTLTPTEIVEDSRCPVDVQCIQAGTVRVKSELVAGSGASSVTFTLGMAISTEGELVTLVEVTPQKRSQVAVKSSDYVFTFEVRKRPDANQQ